MNMFQIIWVSVFSAISFIAFYLVISLSGEVSFLKRKLSLHEDTITILSDEVAMCTDYLNVNCVYCMHNMKLSREEENKE